MNNLTAFDVMALQAVASVELREYHAVEVCYMPHDWGATFLVIVVHYPNPEADEVETFSMDTPLDYDHACDLLDVEIENIRWFNGDDLLYPAEEGEE